MNRNLSNLKMMLSYAKEYMHLLAISAAAIIKVGAGIKGRGCCHQIFVPIAARIKGEDGIYHIAMRGINR